MKSRRNVGLKSCAAVCVGVLAVSTMGLVGCSQIAQKSTSRETTAGISKVTILVAPSSQSQAASQLGLSGEEPVFLGLGVFQNEKEIATLSLRPGLTEIVVPNGTVDFRASYVVYRPEDNSQVFYSKALSKHVISQDGQEIALDFEKFQTIKLRNVYGVAYLNDSTPAADAAIQVRDPWSGALVALPDGSEMARTDERGVFSFPFFYGAKGVAQEVQLAISTPKTKKLVKFALPPKGTEEFTALPFINLTGSLQKSPLALNLALLRGEKGEKGDTGEAGASSGITLAALPPGAGGCTFGGTAVITWKQPEGTSSATYNPDNGSFDRQEVVYCDAADKSGPPEGDVNGDGQQMGPEIETDNNVLLGNLSTMGRLGIFTSADTKAFYPLVGTGTAGHFDVDAQLTFYSIANCGGDKFLGNREDTVGASASNYVKLDDTNPAANSGIPTNVNSIVSRNGNSHVCNGISSQVITSASHNTTVLSSYAFDSWQQLPPSNNGNALQGRPFLAKSSDSGVTFTELAVTGLPQNTQITDIAMLSDSVYWIRAQNGGVFYSSNGGTAWSSPTLSGVSKEVLFNNRGIKMGLSKAFLTGPDGKIFYSSNSGLAWTPVDYSSKNSELAPYPKQILSAVNGKDEVLLYADGTNGYKVYIIDLAPTTPVISLLGSGGLVARPSERSRIFSFRVAATYQLAAVDTESGVAWVSTNNGVSWAQFVLTSLTNLGRIGAFACAATDDCVAAVEQGGIKKIFKTSNFSTWTAALEIAEPTWGGSYGMTGQESALTVFGNNLHLKEGGKTYYATYDATLGYVQKFLVQPVKAFVYPTVDVSLPAGANFPLVDVRQK